MQINGVTIDDSFAEAFPMKATRLVIMARMRFLKPALQTMTMWIRRNRTRSNDTKK